MLKKRSLHLVLYVLFDALAANLAWILFFVYRKLDETPVLSEAISHTFLDKKLYIELPLLTLGWLFLYLIFNFYDKVLQNRLYGNLEKTFITSAIGSIVLFFVIMLNDSVFRMEILFSNFVVFFILHFFITLFFRAIHTAYLRNLVKKAKIGFNTIIIGSGKNAIDTDKKIQQDVSREGYIVIGYVKMNQNSDDFLNEKYRLLGNFEDIHSVIAQNKPDNIIISSEEDDKETLSNIIFELTKYGNISMFLNQNLNNLLNNKVFLNLFSSFTAVWQDTMPIWQKILKRSFDVFFAVLMAVCILPFVPIIVILIKATSKGPVLYTQERVGQYGKSFKILKFRSMRCDAETNVPLLSSDNDDRATKFGKFMRKYRIDEFPQLINVLKNDMSFVGPRPERQYFIDKLIKVSPEYKLIFKVKPGLTSLATVKNGYASNVDQMLARMKFDLMYINNMSLSNDVKILFFTVFTIFRGEGK
ncbi:sugar transferase [Bacteroidia bacterium]|nr:sugar transferase [Bacteroidia bacterium]